MKPSNDQMEAIRRLAREGNSSRLIAEATGVPDRSVARIVAGNGWGGAVVIGRDGRKRKGRKVEHPSGRKCAVCDDPDCDGHVELEQPNDDVPCWACRRFGRVRGRDGRRAPCAVCRARGWLAVEADDRYPSNRPYQWAAGEREQLEADGYDAQAVGWWWESQMDWLALQKVGLVGRSVVPKDTLVRRDWRS